MTRTAKMSTLQENLDNLVEEIVEKISESDEDEDEKAQPNLRHSLPRSNGMDTFHRNAFVNRFTDDYGKPPKNDGIIRYGNKIALKHLRTGRYLHSEKTKETSIDVPEGDRPNNNLQQYKVSSKNWTPHPDHDFWLVLPCLGQLQLIGKPVPYNKELRLKHYETNRHLRVKPSTTEDVDVDKNAPVEVTSFPESLSDVNDVWMIQYFVFSQNWEEAMIHKISERVDGMFWKVDDMISLRHKVTKKVLGSQIDLKNVEKSPLVPVQCEVSAGMDSIWRVIVPVEEEILAS